MENTTELVRLEQFVDKLLNQYNELKAKFRALEVTLQERDSHCASLQDTIAELRGERSMVGDRVAGLIDRIEQWEAEQLAGEGQENEESANAQSTLFEPDQEKT
ncbi:MAG: hypothetical protein GXP57_05795 [Deltaproteobacteria bacterium]|nr:hypothetical protein [Deltaproteobacteria bacterium]